MGGTAGGGAWFDLGPGTRGRGGAFDLERGARACAGSRTGPDRAHSAASAALERFDHRGLAGIVRSGRGSTRAVVRRGRGGGRDLDHARVVAASGQCDQGDARAARPAAGPVSPGRAGR